MQTENLTQYYDDHFKQGYMEEWPIEKINKIKWIINKLTLPDRGIALDFGCGNGVLTNIMQQCLPNWEVYGTDLSGIALVNAAQWFPKCHFFSADTAEAHTGRFDFVFSHHVLEHVENLLPTFAQLTQFLNPHGRMLHCLPCGNPGSLEHDLARLVQNGIDSSRANCFYFEGAEHLRRLTSDGLIELARPHGFIVDKAFYANQFLGAIEWITASKPTLVLKITNPAQGIDPTAKRQLLGWRCGLLTLNLLRMPALIVHNFYSRHTKRGKHYLLLMGALPFYLISRPIDWLLALGKRLEFTRRYTAKNGSEMCLLFIREKP